MARTLTDAQREVLKILSGEQAAYSIVLTYDEYREILEIIPRFIAALEALGIGLELQS